MDEEVFAATLHIFGRAFLKIPEAQMFDIHDTAGAGCEIVGITNTFISQPWKPLMFKCLPWLKEVGGVYAT